MNIFTELLLDQSVKVERFYHRQDEAHHDPEEETASFYTLNFIEKGLFQLHSGKEKWTLGEQNLFVTYPEMNYRFQHFEEIPNDICLSIKFSDSLAEDIFSCSDFDLKKIPPVVLQNNRIGFLYWQISQFIENNRDPLETETVAAELLSAIGNSETPRKIYKKKQMSWYAERVEAICRLFEVEYETPHSLNSLSRFVGLSPFHLTRIFKELTDKSPHQYLIEVRLSKAAEQLLEGLSITEVCYACGFANPSHFTRLFQRTFGTSPRNFQRQKNPICRFKFD